MTRPIMIKERVRLTDSLIMNKAKDNIRIYTRGPLTVENLVRLISSERLEILSAWTKQIKTLGGSYNLVSLAELSDLCEEFLKAFLAILRSNHSLKLRIFIERLSRIRSAQGFRLSEVQRAYYSFYEVLRPRVIQWDAEGKINRNILDKLHAILIDTLFELSESYHRRLNEKIDGYIGELEKLNTELKELSLTDELTGCYNYRYFQNILNIEVARALRYIRPLSMIMFDIDHFKKINDEFGHIFGDEVLKSSGKILLRSLRPSDLAFRYGGEEFSIILPETEREKALICAERIREKISMAPVIARGQEVCVTISGGVDGFHKKVLDKAVLIANADEALYEAKKAGRNRIALYGQ